MKLNAWACTDIGNVRTNNEDSYLVDSGHGVFAVADGVGGRDRGEVASRMAVSGIEAAGEALQSGARLSEASRNPESREQMLDKLRGRLQQINSDVFAEDAHDRDGRAMATTVDALVVSRVGAYVGHVGDSRVYLIRDGEIFRVTEDHTYAQALRRHGRDAVRNWADDYDKYQHMLTRSIGAKPHVEPDTLFLDVRPGDRFVLCTDGLTNYLNGREIGELAAKVDSPKLADRLVAEAKDRGGGDNITVVVVEVPAQQETARTQKPQTIDTIRQVNFLEQIELFAGLNTRELIKVLRSVYERPYGAGDVVLRQGEPSGGLFLIVEGAVNLTVDGTDVGQVQAGQHFGELALFSDDHARSATATSHGESLLLVVSAAKFRQLTTQDLAIGNKLLTNLVRHAGAQIRQMNARVAGPGDDSTQS